MQLNRLANASAGVVFTDSVIDLARSVSSL
jgi:hypothetical protein